MDISVVIPIHEWDDKVKELFDKAVNTILVQDGNEERPEVLVVYAAALLNNKDFSSEIHRDRGLEVTFIKNEEKTDFQSQINLGAKNVKTKYFSILEYDDEYGLTYFKLMNQYISSDKFKGIDVFLPIVIETNEKDDALKFTNETVWSKQFVGENGTLGYLNSTSLNQYTDFKLCGSLLKTEEFNTAGGFKSNIKLTFQYEFLLRFLNNASKIYSVPKSCYKHLTMREGSLFDTLGKTMDAGERKFWFDTAKKEANFFNDRPIDLSSLKKIEQVEASV